MTERNCKKIADVLLDIRQYIYRLTKSYGTTKEQEEDQWSMFYEYYVEPFAKMLERDDPEFDRDLFVNYVEHGVGKLNKLGRNTSLPKRIYLIVKYGLREIWRESKQEIAARRNI